MSYYKVTTHDLRPPLQGGDPIWDGRVPYDLPVVEVDPGPGQCRAGWHACTSPERALHIAGLWPGGWPSRLWRVERTVDEIIDRNGDCRAPTWRIVEEIEITRDILGDMHRPLAGDGLPLADLVGEVLAWREALARPERDETRVVRGLDESLHARGMDWQLRRYPDARTAGTAGTAGTARAWTAWTAWSDWSDWTDWSAWSALTFYIWSRRVCTDHAPDLLTRGIRDAYRAGLGIALPVAPETLGWAMADTAFETKGS